MPFSFSQLRTIRQVNNSGQSVTSSSLSASQFTEFLYGFSGNARSLNVAQTSVNNNKIIPYVVSVNAPSPVNILSDKFIAYRFPYNSNIAQYTIRFLRLAPIECMLIGGGGGGGRFVGGGGGGGGYLITTLNINELKTNTDYNIIVGKGGVSF
jgi:hypothetical protein